MEGQLGKNQGQPGGRGREGGERRGESLHLMGKVSKQNSFRLDNFNKP